MSLEAQSPIALGAAQGLTPTISGVPLVRPLDGFVMWFSLDLS
jgi:hypothetical protein